MRVRTFALAAAAALAVAGLSAPAHAGTTATPGAPTGLSVRDVCGRPAPGDLRCFAQLRTDLPHGTASPGGTAPGRRGAASDGTDAKPAGFGPAELRSAYGLPDAGGADQTVAIIDAGSTPNLAADLAVYRQTYGLPPCTVDDGCLRVVNQAGEAAPLPGDQGWGPEISLDVDMVSAACSACRILVVAADSAAPDDLAAAVDTAAALGATEISNSYGGEEYSGTGRLAAHYRHPGVAIVASSGDYGYQIPQVPAAYDSVVAIGGTSLSTVDGKWTESAWSGAGSGCSAWTAKPGWQHDPNCPGRTVADISAVADPATGVAVYDSADGLDWAVAGGTSASAPLIAGVIALAGHPELFDDASYLYEHAGALRDVVGGSNASEALDCGGDYLCTGVAGYDGPTGLGSPSGLDGFGG
ncbi:S53 family peptidase [Actinocatenispora sera]|uniref:Peptidase S8 n=1 Tax=Actinocatenispora sera TaxID=390989 RepID=A0A810KSY8_9ACTN|nr:S8 family serine peptidase [Actinocatenispora sera]BCJ26333.1 peptidase S8 [Actinocatenispora sera]